MNGRALVLAVLLLALCQSRPALAQGLLTNGGNDTGTIGLGEVDSWTFTANQGEFIALSLRMVTDGGAFVPWLRLYSPSNVLLDSPSGPVAAIDYLVAPATGTFTVTVASHDALGIGMGTYTLTLAHAPGAFAAPGGDDGGEIQMGANHAGTITAGDVDMWSIPAAFGDYIEVSVATVTNTDGSFVPYIRLLNPEGHVIDGSSGTVARAIGSVNGSTNPVGTYTVILSSIGSSPSHGTGTYRLTGVRAPGTFVVPGGDEGGPLTTGTDHLGAIELGDLDAWTFVAAKGDPLVIDLTRTADFGSFTPWARLISPDGLVSGDAIGDAPHITATAQTGGLFTVIVTTNDSARIGTGTYSLKVNGNTSDLVRNGTFGNGETGWLFFALPTAANIVHSVVNGVLEYYRVPAPPGSVTPQAVAYQQSSAALLPRAPVRARFDVGNSSATRKRISVLVLDSDFSDLSVCTFWLPANTPLRTYEMRTVTGRAWRNASIYFYAATAGSDGGAYQVDNVSMEYAPTLTIDGTECVDPGVPAPTGGGPGPNLITNGDFETGVLAPWGLYGQITAQIAAGVFEFIRPPDPVGPPVPAGVVLQYTAQPMTAGTLLTATFDLGNSSPVRKRVTVLLHDSTFADLAACTFWLPPGEPLSPYAIRTYSTGAWGNATVSVYPATKGVEPWMRLDNVTLRRTPSASITGTECVEPPVAAPTP